MQNEFSGENFRERSREIGSACVCFNLRKTTRILSQMYDRALKPAGIKVTQFSLLVAVSGQDGVTIGKLARPMGMDRTTLSRNARILEKKGLIEIGEGDDRREQILRLTEKGAGLLREAIPLWEGVQRQLAEEMGEKRLKELLLDLKEFTRRQGR